MFKPKAVIEEGPQLCFYKPLQRMASKEESQEGMSTLRWHAFFEGPLPLLSALAVFQMQWIAPCGRLERKGYRERANDVHFDFWFCSHLQPLAATCSGSHLQPLVTQASKFQHCTLSSLCKNCKISSSLALQKIRIYSRKSLGL